MRWIQYPNPTDERKRRRGVPREGKVIVELVGRFRVVKPNDGGQLALVMVYDERPEMNMALKGWQGSI